METDGSQRRSRDGISLVETLVAVAITTLAGSALLTSLGAAVQSSTVTAHRLIAQGLADQLADEISAARFPTESDVRSTSTRRVNFEHLDDYHGWSSRPPVDRQGVPIGTEGHQTYMGTIPRLNQLRPDERFLQNFSRHVLVERVRPDNQSGWSAVSEQTEFRRVTVRVAYTDSRGNAQTLAEVSRIYSHVPLTP